MPIRINQEADDGDERAIKRLSEILNIDESFCKNILDTLYEDIFSGGMEFVVLLGVNVYKKDHYLKFQYERNGIVSYHEIEFTNSKFTEIFSEPI